MREPPTNICPLLAIASIGSTYGPSVCIEERCAFWSYGDCECAVHTIVDAIREVADGS